MKLEEVKELLEAAHKEVSAVCNGPYHGGRRWTMCIPARKDDSDLLIGGALRTANKLLAIVEKIAAVKAAHFGDVFWQCDAAPLEHLDDALAELEAYQP